MHVLMAAFLGDRTTITPQFFFLHAFAKEDHQSTTKECFGWPVSLPFSFLHF
jgi:hypothetical protein